MEVKEDDNVCIVCWREIQVYAIGLCDHPVCHECSTRMRVLCRKSECPICRRNLPKVILVTECKPFEELNKRLYQMDARPQMCFQDESVRQAYKELLENRCKYCPAGKRPVFNNLAMLRTHIRKEHHRSFCDLCVEHLKIFPGERRAYSKKELDRHLHSGDLEDTSHKGHPICQFCDVRYFDNDELYRHLRQEHYYCHFCGDDYRLQYYRNYEYLRAHLRQDHFLCEEGDCRNETFTAAFRSEIDLKAHRAQHHNRSMTKAQVKQTRTLDLEINFTPRPSQRTSVHGGSSTACAAISGSQQEDGSSHGRRLPRHGHQRSSRATGQDTHRDEQMARNLLSASSHPRPDHKLDLTWEDQPPVDYRCEKEFPQLGGDEFPQLRGDPLAAASASAAAPKTGTKFTTPYPPRKNELGNVNSVEEFPSLNPLATTTPSGFRASPSGSLTSTSTKPQTNGNAPPIQYSKAKLGGQQDQNNNKSNDRSQPTVSIRLVQPASSVRSTAATSAAAAVSSRGTEKKGTNDVKEPPKPVLDEDFPVLTPRAVPRMSTVVKAAPTPQADPPWQQVKIKPKKKKKAEDPKLSPPSKSNSDSTNGNASAGPTVKNAPTLPPAKAPEATSNLLQLISAARKGTTSQQRGEGLAAVSEGDSTDSESNDGRRPAVSLLSANDFPCLNGRCTANPPPGFQQPKPPPGFVRGVGTDTTGPSINLSLASMVVGPPATPRYMQPAGFQQRNLKLIQDIRQILGEIEPDVLFAKFKSLSGGFRQGSMSADDYFRQCLEVFGSEEKFQAVFPELLFLLPDIRKQQELMATYNSHRKAQGAAGGALPKNGLVQQLLVCATCQQVLSADDFRSHRTLHDPA